MWGAPLPCLFRIILLYVVCGSQLWGRRVSATNILTRIILATMVKCWRVNFMYSFNRFGVTKINQDNLLWVENFVCTDVITNSLVFSGMFMCFRKWCGALYAHKLNKLWYSPIVYDMKTQISNPCWVNIKCGWCEIGKKSAKYWPGELDLLPVSQWTVNCTMKNNGHLDMNIQQLVQIKIGST